MKILWLFLGAVVGFVAALLLPTLHVRLLPDREFVPGSREAVQAQSRIALVPSLGSTAPELLQENGHYGFGRWGAPVRRPELHDISGLQNLLQKKEWAFFALTTPTMLYGIAVAQLNYAATAFFYYFNASSLQYEISNPIVYGGFFTSFMDSSVDGCLSFDAFNTNIHACAVRSPDNPVIVQWQLDARGTFRSGRKLALKATIGSPTSSFGTLALCYPLGVKRPAYTHKSSGMISQGSARHIGKDGSVMDESLEMALSSLDWTRSMHRHLTVWYWVALSWITPQGQRVGINLSHGVYPHSNLNDTAEIGLENAIWIDDVVLPINVPLVVEGAPGGGFVVVGKQWHCSTEDGSLDLTFVPAGIVHSTTPNIGVMAADMRHSFGIYQGVLRQNGQTITFSNVPGILEDHWALW